jgi:GntR family histidine utilization transcriptional repressor
MNGSTTKLGALPRTAARPLYQLIKDRILEQIRSAAWPPGKRLPSENSLVTELGVSRMTVTRALRELAQQGHLRRVHGVGTFVADTPRHASLIELRNIADEIRERGMHHRADVLRLDATHCDAALAADLELAPDTRVYHVQLVHWQNDQPVQLEDRYVNPALAPDFLGVDFHLVTPTQYLIGLFRPDEMEHIVQAVMPDSKTCRWLAIPPEEPCLRLRRRTWKHRVVVTLATFLYPSSRYDLGARYATDAFRKGVEIRASDGN